MTSRTAREIFTWISTSVEDPGVGVESSREAHWETFVSSESMMRGEMYFSVNVSTRVLVWRFLSSMNQFLTRDGEWRSDK